MSFLFGSSKHVTPEPPRLGGLDPDRMNTNEGGRVLPWMAGTRWLGVTWVGNVWSVRTEAITAKVGKKRQTVGHNYYASFAALVCNGPVDTIQRIRFDDAIVWTGPYTREDEDYVTLAIPSRGNVRFYFGTETQPMDSLLTASTYNHAPYRGQCYLVGDGIFFGQDRTNAPNIQVEVTRVGTPSWIPSGQRLIGYDANPMAVLWEWWTDARFGLGRSQDELDVTRLTSVAAQLYTEGIGVSPLLTSDTGTKEALLKLFEYVDGFPTTDGGLLGVELVRPPTGTVPTLTDAQLVDDPAINHETWHDTYDEARVRFADKVLEGAENSAKHHDPANYLITGRHRAVNVDRPWVTSQLVAVKMAGVLGRVSGVPRAKGSLVVRESESGELSLGAVFDLATRDGQSLRLRVVERREPDPGSRDVEISFESDSGWATDDYPAPEADTIPDTPLFEPQPPSGLKILDAPYAFADGDKTLAALMWMVARGDTYSTDYDVWKARTEDGDYLSASSRRSGELFAHFSVRATLDVAVLADTLPVDDYVGISFTVSSDDETLLEDDWDLNDALEHQLVAFVGDAATEIMALYDVTLVSGSSYTAKIVRGLYDSRRRDFPIGTELWLQLGDKVDSYSWPPLSEEERFYKIQIRFGPGEIDLADIDAEAHTENARSLLPIAPLNVAVNGDGNRALWTLGTDAEVTWSNTSRARTDFQLPLSESPATDLDAVVLQVWDYAGATLLDETEVTPTGEAATLTAAYLGSVVGGEFQLRAYGKRSGRRSLDYTAVTVRLN